MWAKQLTVPLSFADVEVATPTASQLGPTATLVRLVAGAICGSDTPMAAGRNLYDGTARPGWPLHEVLGEVVHSPDPDLPKGKLVVGWAVPAEGLAELVVTASDNLAVVRVPGRPVEQVMNQSIACVTSALDRLGDVRGRHVAVFGLGPFGLLFAQALRDRGARRVVGIDPVARGDDIRRLFGLDEIVQSTSTVWAAGLSPDDRPEVIVETVGHQVRTLEDAITAIRPHGTIYQYGVPDDNLYAFSLRSFFLKRLTLKSGGTDDRRKFLLAAQDWYLGHREQVEGLISHVFPITDATAAYQLAARPSPDRRKVALTV
jgi:threonine dehydrogenase-like Zn-dependent dehydrogenase